MDLATLELLIDVSRLGGFSAAARPRNLDPSSVSRAVAAAESELGVRLFQRTTRRLALTEEGERYIARIEPLVAEFAAARDDARTAKASPSGLLRMTASVAFGVRRLGPLLPGLHAAFPDLVFDILYSDANVDLVGERVDLAIRLGPARDSDLVGVKLMNTRYRVCASPGYLARTTAALDDPADLARHPCLRFRFAPFDVRWLTRANETAEILEIPVDGPLLASNALALQDAARAGLGPALLADWLVAEDVAAGALVELFPTYEFTATTWDTAAWALYPSKAYLPWKTRATLDWLKAALRNPAA